MKLKILNKDQEARWDKFLQIHELATMHQSLPWLHFQEKVATRGKYWILALEEDGEIVGGTVIIRHRLPRNLCWFYASRGPLLNEYHSEKASLAMDLIMQALKPIAKEENAVFLRIDPPLEDNAPKFKGFKESMAGFYPEHTLILDIDKPEEEILRQMKPKGRYNIKVAQKNEVQVSKVDPNDKDFDRILDLYCKIVAETTERDGFYAHRKSFYRAMISTLDSENLGKLYTASYKGKLISGIVATFFKETATYYYGASSDADRNVMAPYLLQWEVIRDAKARGCKYYDFLGIAPPDEPKHAWVGVTAFKRKFGGRDHSYIRCQEYAFRPFVYFLYRLHKWAKKTF